MQSSSTQVGTASNMMGLVHHAVVYCTDVYLCSKYAVWNTDLFFSFEKALKMCLGNIRVHVHVSRTLNTYWCSGLLQGLVSEAGYMVDNGREVGGTVELNLRQTRPVRFHHTFDACAHIDNNSFTSPSANLSIFRVQQCFKQTCAKWIRWVEIERKLMGNLLSQTISSSCHILNYSITFKLHASNVMNAFVTSHFTW